MTPAEEIALAFLRKAPLAKNLPALVADFGRAVECFGYSHYACLQFAKPGRPVEVKILFGHVHWSWQAQYMTEGLDRYDTGVKMLFATTLPYSWKDMRNRARSRDEVRVFDAARNQSLRGGLVIPVHDAEGGVSAVVLHGEHADDPDPQVRATLAAMSTLFAAHGQSLLQADEDRLDTGETLSLRERQCLLLACDGKTNFEIGQELSISKRTVDIHIERARAALGARNRTHAVVAALQTGLLRETERPR